MRKIWTSRKDKRRSLSSTGSPSLYNISQFDADGDSSHSQTQSHAQSLSISDDYDDYSTLNGSEVGSPVLQQNQHQPHHILHLGRHDHNSGKNAVSGNSSVATSQTHTRNRSSISSIHPGPKTVQQLVRPDYDSRVIKNGWLNGLMNPNSAPEISDQTLKLVRAELKGSHLYLYKPPLSLNIKNFKLDNSGSTSNDTNDESFYPTPTPTELHGNASTPSLSAHEGLYNSNSSNNSNIHEIGSPVLLSSSNSQTTPTIVQSQSMGSAFTTPNPNTTLLDTPPLNQPSTSVIDPDDFVITYYSTKLPHPDLNFDFKNHQFITSTASFCQSCGVTPSTTPNSIESLIHFILFNEDEVDNAQILDLINILPIFPNFGRILKLIAIFLSDIYNHKFKGYYNQAVVIERVLKILYNVEENFDGFLLKSDIAPYILRILETLSEPESTETEITNIQKFKKDMLNKQQSLVNLVNNDHVPSDVNPFQDLNSIVFMKDINLVDFVQAISAIDLKFFKHWNSNIDKSLLLYSSINGNFDSSSSHGTADYFYKKNPLIFNNDHHIHYLSRLLINHIFVESSSSTLSSSSLERKARLLEKWIDLGCLLDKSGNMSSWLGISSIILSQPVLRLTKIWSLVSPNYIKLLKSDWSPVLFELDRRHLANGTSYEKLHSSPSASPDKDDLRDSINFKDSYHIMAPRGLGKIYPKERVIPYFGDLVINNNSTADIFELESIWKRINYSFSRWNEYLSNLTNYYEIIKYNDDVLRRYDSMGFIFSNESLNQVLYLGANEDGKPLPSQNEEIRPQLKRTNSTDLQQKLLKLIEINCDSINLEKIMRLSINLEPDLPESYLKVEMSTSVIPNTPLELSFMRNRNMSNLSIHSNGSNSSLNGDSSTIYETVTGKSGIEYNPESRIPSFNDRYFTINLSKYDELTAYSNNEDSSHNQKLLDPSVSKHNFIINDDLTFRIDDFVNELDPTAVNFNSIDDVIVEVEDDVPGLGIDVDDILNSEKFNNFTISPKLGSGNTKKFGGISGDSLNGASNHSKDLPIRFIPKYATMDKLIDLLLIDVKYFHQEITLDLTEYRFVFLLNYNSFITTKELLDKLALRFINSGNAVISVMKREYLKRTGVRSPRVDFPNWSLDTTVDLNELGDVDYELLLKIQINILKVLIVLVNNFYSNFSLDMGNKKILIKLLKLFSNEILQWYNSNKIDSKLEKSFESLVNYYKKLKKLFVKKTYRPIEISKFDEYLIKEFKFNNSLHEVPMNRNLPSHRNVSKIEKFLLKFNKLLTVFYKGIKAEDWVRVYKIIETVFEENNLFEFNLQKSTVSEDYMIVSNVFNYFESLVDPVERQLILKRFPLVFRKLFKLYFKFRSYILIQLTDLGITVEERLDRMKTLLIMCKISKLKMSDNQFVFEGGRGNIPSCIETAITNVIYSPESRLFASLWIKASVQLNDDVPASSTSVYEDLDMLLPHKLTSSDLQSGEPLLPCFGWIIENIIETNKCPSFFKNAINFNKRYLIFKLIKELGVEDIDGTGEGANFSSHDSREFDFLLKLDESLVDTQSIREFTHHDKERGKLFKSVLNEQQRLLVDDNMKKQLRESKTSSGAGNSAAASNSLTLQKKTSNSSLKRQSLSYKSNSSSRFKISGLFGKSRPFSLNGYSSTERRVSSQELPNIESILDTKQKPFAIIALKSKKIFPVYLLPLCFKVDSDVAGDDVFFQAPNQADLNDWLVKLNYANRHWFFSRNLNLKNNHPMTTFGIPITVVCAREQSTYPTFLELIFDEIESEGLKDVGIYRISTSISELANVKAIIDRTGTLNVNEKPYDTHTLTSIVKSYFRELPDALLSDKVINSFFSLNRLSEEIDDEVDDPRTLDKYKEVLKELPSVNYNTLKLLLKHLQKVSHFSEDNKMTTSNLATVIGPALTEASNLEILINNFGFMNSILEKLIINYDYVFDDIVITSFVEQVKMSPVQESNFA
ncbi:hypothetical protein G9P44_003086 [Scheffersomyces stipitis]|nr:hypothetical protein G9P44_003086 [Scheffersomyces stipitis]